MLQFVENELSLIRLRRKRIDEKHPGAHCKKKTKQKALAFVHMSELSKQKNIHVPR